MRLGEWAPAGPAHQLTYLCLSGLLYLVPVHHPSPALQLSLLVQPNRQDPCLPSLKFPSCRPNSARLTRPKLVSDQLPFVNGCCSDGRLLLGL